MVKLLQELRREVTIVLVEHDMDAVFALADRITVLVYGRVIASDVPAAIRQNEEVSAPISAISIGVPMSEKVMADAPLCLKSPISDLLRLSQVLFGLSLQVRTGEMVTLMGRNAWGRPRRSGRSWG